MQLRAKLVGCNHGLSRQLRGLCEVCRGSTEGKATGGEVVSKKRIEEGVEK